MLNNNEYLNNQFCASFRKRSASSLALKLVPPLSVTPLTLMVGVPETLASPIAYLDQDLVLLS